LALSFFTTGFPTPQSSDVARVFAGIGID